MASDIDGLSQTPNKPILGSVIYPMGNLSGFVNQLSMDLDGVNDRVSIPNDVSLQVGPAFSVSLWLKVPVGVSNFATAMAKSNGTNNGWTIQLRQLNADWRFWVNFGNNLLGNGSNGGWYYSSLARTWQDGGWHHVVGVWDGVAPKLYVDTVLGVNAVAPSGEGSLPSISVDTALPMMIGAESDAGNHTAALHEEVQFYNLALDAAAVTDIFNGGTPKDETGRAGAVSQYRMGDDPLDDATGTTGNIEDIVGANNGTPLNTVAGDFVMDVP